MFTDDEAPKKTITMSMYGPDNEHIEMTMEYSNDDSWMTISNQYYRFLNAMGYIVEPEAVGGGY